MDPHNVRPDIDELILDVEHRWWHRRKAQAQAIVALGIVIVLLVGAFLLHADVREDAGSARIRMLIPPTVSETRYLPVTPETAKSLNAAVPIVDPHPDPAKPFKFTADAAARARAVDCLAAAAWYEAGDDAIGEKAVVQTVLNRARHPAFPKTVCGVVFQGSERSTGCQFTFTCDGALARVPSAEAWKRAQAIAQAAIDGAVDATVGNATHYHADYVVPYWQSTLDKIAQVGPHLYYRWRGFWGTPAAFNRVTDGNEPVITKLAALSAAHGGGAGLLAGELPIDSASQAALLPPPAPIAVEGVAEKSLRQAVVRGHAANANQFFIEVDGAGFPGNYATAAVALCRNRAHCVVLAWRNAGHMGTAFPLSPGQWRELTFYYFHDDATGDRALWNCAQIERKNTAQCLPADQSALMALPN